MTTATTTCRHLLPIAGVHFCRCPRVHTAGNLVKPEVHCVGCRFHDAPGEQRPVPADVDAGLVEKMTTRPTLIRRIFNFGMAGARLIAAKLRGDHLWRTQEEIDARLKICAACPLFDGRICTHKRCGCNVSREETFFNKLAWTTESCPDNPPRWT